MLIQTENLEFVSPTLKRSWLSDHRIVVFEPTDGRRQSVDDWYQFTLETSQQWPEGQTYLELQDMRAVTISPYAQKKALNLIVEMGDVEGYSAIIVPKSHTGEVMRFFVNRLFGRVRTKVQRRIFYEVDKAKEWLESKL